jgi:hypothetical protein
MDPITFGPTMHIYYSNDTEPNFDEKLWTPISRNYILKKGFAALPQPIYCRFVKLEFSKLTPSPYTSLDYPVAPQITYRKFPSWVQLHFDTISTNDNQISAGIFDNPFDRVTIDPLTFGFQVSEDRLNSSFADVRVTTPTESEDEIRTFISNIIETPTGSTNVQVQQEQESQIQFFGSTMWQSDLISQLDLTRAYSRYIAQTSVDGGTINAELPPLQDTPPDVQSVSDLTEVRIEKEKPIMFFPRTCRHQYQVVRSSRPTKIAYFVAIRDVSFYRRDFGAMYDEPVYYETLDDAAHIEVNDFVRSDWKFEIQP